MNKQSELIKSQQVWSYQAGELETANDQVVVEYVLTLYIDEQEFATMICTPQHLPDLIIGFLAAEGLIRSTEQISKLEVDVPKGTAEIKLSGEAQRLKESFGKRWVGSCCGKSRLFYFESDLKTAKTIVKQQPFHAERCLELMRALQQRSTAFQQTGGVHNAALANEQELLIIRTDIGRHNALDKIFGAWLQHPMPLQDKAVVFSGRVSSEVILKTAKIGVGLLVSKSAPSDLAIQFAHELNSTLIGFARKDRFNVYTHPQRIKT